MTVAVLYVQRALSGGALSGLRLSHLRGEMEWTAPVGEKAQQDPLAIVVSAAQWASEQLKLTPGPAQLTVVIDPQGTNCQWLSAPTADDAVVRAAVRDAMNAGDDEEGSVALSWLGDSAPGSDVSVQGLADVAVLDRKSARKGNTGSRQRMALLSVNDLPVRLLLDELDKRDVVVGRVCTFWHAMALAWDPAARNATAAADERVVSASDPVGAVVTIDPSGMLAWCWSQQGTMLAGGTLLLRKAPVDLPVEAGLRIAGDTPVLDRPHIESIEAVKADIGRLTSDWLGWSVQLGLAPARVAVIGPKALLCSGDSVGVPGLEGLAALGAGLGKHWTGATVHATSDEDAAGRTLKRLVDVENGVSPASGPAAAVDPRLSLTELSGRPGAADRRLHRWAGLTLLIGAIGVGMIGWRVGRTIDGIRQESLRLREEQAAMIKSLAWAAPAAQSSDVPELVLRSKRVEMEKARADQKDEEPILAEAERVLLVLAAVPDVRLRTMQINSLGVLSRFELSVPIDGDQGPTVKDLLDVRPSQSNRIVKWDGRHVRTGDTERRNWTMAGSFVDAPKRVQKPAPDRIDPPVTPAAPAAPATENGASPANAPADAPQVPGPTAAPDAAKPDTPKPDAPPGVLPPMPEVPK